MQKVRLTPAVMSAAVCLAACQADTLTEPPGAPEAPSDPEIGLNRSASTAPGGNSPYYSELTHVFGMGLVDGTTCEAWPKDFRFDTPFPMSASGSDVAEGRAAP